MNQNIFQFITCPKCKGELNKNGAPCNECNNIGIGTFSEKYFFYWNILLNKNLIIFNRLKRALNPFFNASLYFGGILGTLSLYWFFSKGLNNGNWKFWEQRNVFVLIFWIGIVSLNFALYRELKSKKEAKIKKIKKSTLNKLPDNWNELKTISDSFKINVAPSLNESTLKLIENAFLNALKLKHGNIEILHLGLEFLKDKTVIAFLKRLNISQDKLSIFLSNQILALPTSQDNKKIIDFSFEAKKAFIEAYLNLKDTKENKIEAYELILFLMRHDYVFRSVFYEFGVDEEKIFNCQEWFKMDKELVKKRKEYIKLAKQRWLRIDRNYKVVATPVLDYFTFDLLAQAKMNKLDFCLERENEIIEVENTLEKEGSCIIFGEYGIGKDSLINGLCQKIAEEKITKSLRDKRIVKLNIKKIMSVFEKRELEERILVLMDEIEKAGNIILYISSIEPILKISPQAQKVFKTMLEQKKFILIISLNQESLKKNESKILFFSEIKKIELAEMSISSAIRVAESKIVNWEKRYKVYFYYDAIEMAVYLSRKYLEHRYLPQKALEILEQVAREKEKELKNKRSITQKDIFNLISKLSGISIEELNEKEKSLNWEKELGEKFIGQKELIESISNTLRKKRQEIRDPQKPIASFLLIGHQGSGKTELAKVLAEVYFKERKIIAIDLNLKDQLDNFKTKIQTEFLNGKNNNIFNNVIVFDNFENIDSELLDSLNEIFKFGQLKLDGRLIDFRYSIFIALTNLGSQYVKEQFLIGAELIKIKNDLIEKTLSLKLNRETLDLFDDILVFKPLVYEDILKIANLKLKKIEKTLNQNGIILKINEKWIENLVEKSFDGKFGGWNLKKNLEEKIENVIAKKILNGEVKKSNVIFLDENGNVIVNKF